MSNSQADVSQEPPHPSYQYIWAVLFLIFGCVIIAVAVSIKNPVAVNEIGKAIGGALIVFAVFDTLTIGAMNWINKRMAGWTPEWEKLYYDLRKDNADFGVQTQELQANIEAFVQDHTRRTVDDIDNEMRELTKKLDAMAEDMKERLTYLEFRLAKGSQDHEYDSLLEQSAKSSRRFLAHKKYEAELEAEQDQNNGTAQ